MLAPYWASRLGKTELHAFQASRRGGELKCRLVGDRVELEGACVFYLEREVEVEIDQQSLAQESSTDYTALLKPQPKHPERMKLNSRGRAALREAHGSLKQKP